MTGRTGIDAAAARSLVVRALAARPDGGWLGADEVWTLLGAASLPVVASEVVADLDAARDAAARLGYPVALKAASGELVHKSDVGAVALGVDGPDALAAAYHAIDARLGAKGASLVIQPMVAAGLEVIVGMSADPHFGPLVVFGLGGVATDLLGDHSFGVPPITRDEAVAMLHSLRTSPLLTGYRGTAGVALEPIAEVIRRVGALAELCPEIAELDCNPVVASPSGAVIVDAKVRLAPHADAPDQLARTLRRPARDAGC